MMWIPELVKKWAQSWHAWTKSKKRLTAAEEVRVCVRVLVRVRVRVCAYF